MIGKQPAHQMALGSETADACAAITDPGPALLYIKVCDGDRTFKVYKTCRVELFDAFWVSDPLGANRQILPSSQVPTELWSILTEEERWMSRFQQARSETRRLKRVNELLGSIIGVLCLVVMTLGVLYFS